MNRNLLLCGVASLALFTAGSATAADLPVKAPAFVPAPVFSWTGCYVGGHVGWGWAKNDTSNTFVTSSGPATQTLNASGRLEASGAMFGGQVGCNYQFASNWVVGIEGGVSAADINGSALDPRSALIFFTNPSDADNFNHVKIDWIATVTGRLGYAWGMNLLYVKGGAAWAHNRWNVSDSLVAAPFGERQYTRDGWTVGAGYEWAFKFAPDISMFVEYDHYDFGTRNLASPADAGGATFPFIGNRTLFFNVKQTVEVAKVGVNYRFVPWH